MALVLPDVGEKKLLELMLEVSTVQDMTMRLYNALANSPLDDATVIGDFTESTATSYVGQAIVYTGWTIVNDGAAPNTTTATHTQLTFTFGSSDTILGYYVTEDGGGVLCWCEAFAASAVISGTGEIKVTPKIQLA